MLITRLANESWRDAVARIAGSRGLKRECVDLFDMYVRERIEEGDAAFAALYGWDCCGLGAEVVR